MNYLGRLKSWIKAKIASSEAHKYKMEIAVLSAIIFLFAVSFSISESVRFFCKEHPGILIVVISVAGEIVCEWRTEKSFIERLKKFFGICLVVGLLLEIAEAVKSDKQVETLRGENLVLQTNVVAMNDAVIRLAHQYDLSTNALAEANSRLATIKPAKQRLIDLLNILNLKILEDLKAAKQSGYSVLQENIGMIPQAKWAELQTLKDDPGIANFLTKMDSNRNFDFTSETTGPITLYLSVTLLDK